MADPTILFVKPQAISADDKAVLREAGVLVIEIENPRDAKFVRAGAELSGTALLCAAAHALATSDHSTKEFGRAVIAAIDAQYATQK